MSPGERNARRARRLLRLYPSAWRERYGEEFEQLLIDDIGERPHSLSRILDIVRTSLLARGTLLAHSQGRPEHERETRAALLLIGAAAVAFLAVAVALWGQATVVWLWAPPAQTSIRAGMLLMSAAVAIFIGLALLATAPLLWALTRELIAGRGRRLAIPLLVCTCGMALFVAASIHIGRAWPASGAHPWAWHSLVPAGIARFCWAATLWVTTYWAHPHALAQFPAQQIEWMVAAPIVLLRTTLSAGRLLNRLPLCTRTLRYESWLGLAAAVAMGLFLCGAGCWLIISAHDSGRLFGSGLIDVVEYTFLGIALLVCAALSRRMLGFGSRRPTGS